MSRVTAKRRGRGPRRVVLDSALVLRALLRSDAQAQQLRRAWQSDDWRVLVSPRTAQLLMLSLSSPALRLSPVQQQELLADFLPYAEVCKPESQSLRSRLAPCQQWALTLALEGAADLLVSEDAALIAHVRRVGADRYPGLIRVDCAQWLTLV